VNLRCKRGALSAFGSLDVDIGSGAASTDVRAGRDGTSRPIFPFGAESRGNTEHLRVPGGDGRIYGVALDAQFALRPTSHRGGCGALPNTCSPMEPRVPTGRSAERRRGRVDGGTRSCMPGESGAMRFCLRVLLLVAAPALMSAQVACRHLRQAAVSACAPRSALSHLPRAVTWESRFGDSFRSFPSPDSVWPIAMTCHPTCGSMVRAAEKGGQAARVFAPAASATTKTATCDPVTASTDRRSGMNVARAEPEPVHVVSYARA